MSLRDKLEAAKAAKLAQSQPIPPEARKDPPKEILPEQTLKSECFMGKEEPIPAEIKSPEPQSGLNRFKKNVVLTQEPKKIIQPTAVLQKPITVVQPPAIPTELKGSTADLEKLRTNLDYLAKNIEQKELVGQVVRTIAIQLRQNPTLAEGMVNADFDLLVRGLRRAYQVAARNKTEKRTATASKKEAEAEFTQIFKDMGL